MLDVKKAAKLASENLVSLLGQDSISSVQLEEVELANGDAWVLEGSEDVDPQESGMHTDVPKGFYWNITLSYLPAKPNPLVPGEGQRQYKIFKIDAVNGDLVAMKIRKAA